jgi:hypothetical protein
MRRVAISLCLVFAPGASLPAETAAPQGAAPAERPVRFNRDIRPILAENCFHCHGPDPGSRQGKLRLDREEGFFADRGEGPMVVRGKPEASPLYKRLMSSDSDEVMPPPKAKKKLKPEHKDLFRRWIAQGAPWEPHWSFLKPERPAPPAVKNEKWVRNFIDRFILARLEAVGLTPAPEADRRALVRRLSLDVTGLPPAPELVDAFVADASPRAFESLVDTLLQSPRYGEHRARPWLDAARYADTHGLHFDNYREIWPYRDWVIAAYNRNMPFDQFTVEQLAGDLLPDPTPEQIVATGFHRCNITTNEGGTIAEENLANYARDRVETTSWVWLGLTANCAVCHDHKFDPITMKDFYSMAAFFRNTTQGALDGNVKDSAPVLVLPKPEDAKRWSAIPGEIDQVQKAMAARKGVLRAAFDAWLETAAPDAWEAEVAKIGPPAFHLPLDTEPPGPEIAATLQGKPVAAKAQGPTKWIDSGRKGKALLLEGQTTIDLGDVGPFEKDTPFSFGCWVRLNANFQGSASLFARMDDDEGYRGWDLWVQGNEFAAHLIHKWKDDAIKVSSTGNLVKRGAWQHVFVTYDGSGKAEGFRIYVDGKAAKLNIEANSLKSTARTPAPLQLGRRKKSGVLTGGALQDVRLYSRRLSAGEVQRLAVHQKAVELLSKAPKARAAKEKQELFDVTSTGDSELAAISDKLAALEAERKAIRDRAPVTHIMEERKGAMPTANILFRGEYDKPRDKVEAAVFASLNPLPPGAPKNRLGLARWLVSRDNPLTARVMVNRYWQEIFGTGLVKTAEDFGIMGEPPSHPELLDALAVEFREHWDTKRILKLILTSATYRQAAAATKEKLEKDPANRLLSRGPRFRMDAEMIRDYALAASGTLSARTGGPSVKPYQPEGVWEAVGMNESNTKIYKRDSGEALYRRSLYSFWKRMAPPASMEILNAPSREMACVRRERTNTPLQALVTLNDPQFIEAARALAQAAMKQGADDKARLAYVARRILCRPLGEKEAEVVFRVRASLLGHYKAKPEDAKALIAVGESKPDPALDPAELATWTMVCNQLFNLDEVLNK